MGRTMPPHDQNLQKSFQVPTRKKKRNLKRCSRTNGKMKRDE